MVCEDVSFCKLSAPGLLLFHSHSRQFAIGERAELIQTDKGNILWDLIPFLDQETVDKIVDLGGLEAIVISHPHYYSTWADWSRTFNGPVYVSCPMSSRGVLWLAETS